MSLAHSTCHARMIVPCRKKKKTFHAHLGFGAVYFDVQCIVHMYRIIFAFWSLVLLQQLLFVNALLFIFQWHFRHLLLSTPPIEKH